MEAVICQRPPKVSACDNVHEVLRERPTPISPLWGVDSWRLPRTPHGSLPCHSHAKVTSGP